MRMRLLDFLVCPLDKTRLELRAWETLDRPLSAEQLARCHRYGIPPEPLTKVVARGVLINPQRKLLYPIHHGVPRMLTFASSVARQFSQENAAALASDFPGYSLPNEPSMPGEADVLRTFSTEWLNYDWDAQSYWNLTPEAWFRCMRFALELERWPVDGKLALEVGTGVGGVADYVATREGGEVVAVDLGYAIDVAQQHFGEKNPFLHPVQASAFALPFRPQTFDFVFSYGVIHHTFSTRTAFERLAPLPRQGGRLFVWVYSYYDESRTLKRRLLMTMEHIVRPVVWRLPGRLQAVALAPLAPLYMAHQWWKSRHGEGKVIRYGWREAMHAARDRFTPRYVQRHTDEEVAQWFQAAGYGQLSIASRRQRPDDVPEPFTACVGISGIRQ